MASFTYTAKKVFVLVGNIPMTGFGENDKVEIDYKEDQFSAHTDCDGDSVTFVQNNDEQGTIKITVKEASPAVLILAGIIATAKATGKPFPISIANLNSVRTHYAAECMPMKRPTEKMGKDEPMLEYTFVFAKVTTTP